MIADEFHFFTVPFRFFSYHNSLLDFRNPSTKFHLVPDFFNIFFVFSKLLSLIK